MNALTRWNPFSVARRDDLFEDLFRDFLRRTNNDLLEPAVDVAESDADITVTLEVPGVARENLNVSLGDHTLTVRGETRKETEHKGKSYHRQEIRYGAFQRSVPLPTDVDTAKAQAKLTDGMLKITLPKAAQARAKRVDVAVG